MSRFRFAARVDLGVYYDADAARYDTPGLQALQIVTKEVFIAYYKDCPSIGFECDEKPIGGIIFDGEQAHIAVRPEYHVRWALLLRPALDWLFSLKTEIIADVDAGNSALLQFLNCTRWPA